MEQLRIEKLGFAYPGAGKKALDEVSFNVERGEFIVLCGESGSGKTTLLRHLKTGLAPAGEKSGQVLFNGENIENLPLKLSAAAIGFVNQNPEAQIVTDKVWHELAFGQENIGRSRDEMKLRTAEMAAYFGITGLLDKNTNELSGGQKQLLNLAAVMVMGPEVLILDEPTSQLDPVSASGFLSTVSRLNREFGITVVLTEHRLEEALGYASRVIVLQNGRVQADCPPAELAARAGEFDEYVRLSMPAAVRIFSALGETESCGLTVNEAAQRLTRLVGEQPRFTALEMEQREKSDSVIRVKNVSFRYTKNGADVLRELNLEIPRGSIFAIMGGNGAGKSTLLKVIAGVLKPYSGKVIFADKGDKAVMLPQNVLPLFTRDTVRQELTAAGAENPEELAAITEISALLDRHPYDLSGGEQQRAALAMLLAGSPSVLMLDEPTKGMDSRFKKNLISVLKKLAASGKTVVMVSHDVEFCAGAADYCAMIFDSSAAAVRPAGEFFSDNFFYTTAANRMSRHLFKNCVTEKDVTELCRKNLQK